MKRIGILIIGLFTIFAAINGQAADYTITRVIDVDSADWVPERGPLRWSPDGLNLAYFNDGYLMLSDTLGGNHQIKKIDMIPDHYEWLSNDQIIIALRSLENTTATVKLSVLDVSSGEETILIERQQDVYTHMSDVEGAFAGPHLTIEGNAYYTVMDNNIPRVVFPQREYISGQKAPEPTNNHILRWGDNGLYLVRLDAGDSALLTTFPLSPPYRKPLISTDRFYIMTGNILIRVVDSTIILLDTLLKSNYPQVAEGCGFLFGSFNPQESEILFQIGCENDNIYADNRIGTFNYINGDFALIDPIIGKYNCTAPVYAPDGLKIAFLSDGKVYILYRKLIIPSNK
jgi:hypothetical protein